jgi:hypothetical protein
MCYEIRLADYGEDQVLYILVCCNFKVLVEGPQSFEDEVRTLPVVAAPVLVQIGVGDVVVEDANTTVSAKTTD